MRGVAILIVLLPATAMASEPPIAIAQVDVTVPPSGAGVPVNVRPIAYSSNGVSSSVTFTRLDDGTTIDAQAFPADQNSGAFLLNVPALAADETLTIQSSDNGEPFSWAATRALDTTPPAFDDDVAGELVVRGARDGGFDAFTRRYNVNLQLPDARDDSGFVVLRVDGDEGLALFMRPQESGIANFVHFTVEGGEPRVFCFRVVAVDVAGNETQFPEDICTDFADASGRGCASTPGVPAWLALILLVARFRLRSPFRA